MSKVHLRRELPPLIFLALATLAFFWPVTLGQGWIPHGGGDLVSFLWPTYAHAARTLKSGHVPLWNPTLYAGAPFLADNQTGVFYPPNLLAFLLAPELSYLWMEWLVVLHFFVAGVAMYVCLRSLNLAPDPGDRLPLGRLPALFGALAYMFSSAFVTHVGNLNTVAVPAWLPLAFALLRLALLYRSAGWAVGAGAVLALQLLAGQAHMAFIGLWALAGLVVWVLAANILRVWTLAGLGLLALAVGIGLSALTLIPAVELAGYSARARLDFETVAQYSIPPAGLVELISPLIFGRGAAGFWGPWDRIESGYLGVLPLVMLPWAWPRRWRDPRTFFWLLAAFGLALALGRYTPVYRWLYELAPGFAQFRGPGRFILLVDFALAALGAVGMEAALKNSLTRRGAGWGALGTLAAVAVGWLVFRQVSAGIGEPPASHEAGVRAGLLGFAGLAAAGAALIGFKNRLGRRRVAVLLVALLALDLFALGAFVEVEFQDPTAGFDHPRALAFLSSQPGPFRIDSAAQVWQPNTAALAGLEDIGGVSNPLSLTTYNRYFQSLGYRGSPHYNFLSVKFLVADKDRPAADASFIPVFNEDPDLDIYLNTNARPRVRLVYEAVVARDPEHAFELIHAPDFDPERRVVVEDAAGLSGDSPQGESNLYYLEYAAGRFTVVAQTPAPAYLVFSEVWYPGWRATVDGKPVPIVRANTAFRAVRLPPGEHTVTMRFRPGSWRLGLTVTLGTLLALAGWSGWKILR